MPKEQQWVRGDQRPARLPPSIQAIMDEAVVKMAAIYGLDLKSKPSRRCMCYEYIGLLVEAMTPTDIRNWLEHGKSAAIAKNDHSEGV